MRLVVTSAKAADGLLTFPGQCEISVPLSGNGAGITLALSAVPIQTSCGAVSSFTDQTPPLLGFFGLLSQERLRIPSLSITLSLARLPQPHLSSLSQVGEF